MASKTLQRLGKILIDPVAWPVSRRELRARLDHSPGDGPEEALGVMDAYCGAGFYRRIRAVQHREEILELARVVREARPKVVLEIGTHLGGTFFLWCRINPQADLIVGLDLPRASGGYETRRERLYREFAHGRPGTHLTLLRANSHEEATREVLHGHLGGRPIDFLFIDGDHSYEGVRRDFTLYAPLVRPNGGIIAFHDIVTAGPEHEVPRFWNEVRAAQPNREIIRDPSGRMGIGLLFPVQAGVSP